MFDSWGEFWNGADSVEENGETYKQGASGKEFCRLIKKDIGVVPCFVNRSKGGMTSRYGKYWFNTLVVSQKPKYVLLNYGINDYHTNTNPGAFANVLDPYGNIIDMSEPVTKEEFAKNMKEIYSLAITNKIQPIYVGGCIAQLPQWMSAYLTNISNKVV